MNAQAANGYNIVNVNDPAMLAHPGPWPMRIGGATTMKNTPARPDSGSLAFDFSGPPSVQSMTGQRFGRLTVLSFSHWREFKCGKRHPHVLCSCACGKSCTVDAGAVKAGYSKSCGCMGDEARRAAKKHGHSAGGKCTRIYESWTHFLGRCNNPTDKGYSNYGGRGIRVCRRWHSFTAFAEDMGEMPDGMFIDRIDNDSHYSCGHCEECQQNGWTANCRWATRQQNNANRRSCIMLDVNGTRMTASDAARLHGLNPTTVHARLRKGYSTEQALRSVKR